jgi:hypothetical protein
VTILGGPPRSDAPNTDANFIVTAVRHLHEKTCSVLPNESVAGIMNLCAANSADSLAHYYWAKGKYVLLIYPLTHDQQIADVFQGVRQQQPTNTPKIASSLAWISVEDLYAANAAGTLRVNGQDVKIYSLVKSMLGEAQVLASYLSGLQQRLQATTPPSTPPSLFGAAALLPSPSSVFGGGAPATTPGAGGLFGTPGLGSVVATPQSLFGVGAPAAAASARPNFQVVADQFGSAFFDAFNTNKAALGAYFNDQSMLTVMSEQILGAAPILAKLQTLQVQLAPTVMSAQPFASTGALLIVLGAIANTTTKFAMTFTLVPNGASFVVHNMVLSSH